MAKERAISLKEARDQGKLGDFIAEREGETGDEAAFNRALASMAGKSKEAPEASPPDCADD